MTMKTSTTAFLISLVLILSCGVMLSCTNVTPEEIVDDESYVLPRSHPDNESQLKDMFFQEPFRNLDNEMTQLHEHVGIPMVLIMFPSFLTDDGRTSLLGIESIQRSYPDTLRAVFIPMEDRDTIEPVLMQDPSGMMFLFRAAEGGNLSLIDKYENLFWDPDIIAADFPLDPAAAHHTSPFYWVIDADGNIREKLIDYSDARGVGLDELKEVLEALIGPSNNTE